MAKKNNKFHLRDIILLALGSCLYVQRADHCLYTAQTANDG